MLRGFSREVVWGEKSFRPIDVAASLQHFEDLSARVWRCFRRQKSVEPLDFTGAGGHKEEVESGDIISCITF